MTERKKFFLEVSGNKDDLAAFLNICQFIETYETKGTCGSIKIIVNGDGSASLKFRFGTNPNLPPSNLPETKTDLDEIKAIWIGE